MAQLDHVFSRQCRSYTRGTRDHARAPPPPSNGAEREREREKEGENRRETDTERAGMEWVGEEEGVGDTMEVVIGCCSGKGGGGELPVITGKSYHIRKPETSLYINVEHTQ